ncbi:YlaH-like family protein [Camelliibacillus cellulosilyticus]|uniref:YlaH-like family protein n=1 Tax=Camelliibacillus cellulosilyticus TaxID=2174486 RepID=A0ABV9GKM0_9BACL
MFDNPITQDHAIVILYFTIVILSIVVYKLGFARKLPILKSVIIYVMLLIGCIILTVLALQLPIVGALFIAAVVLSIYKIRLKLAKKKSDVRHDA